MTLHDFLDNRDGLTDEAIRFIEGTDQVANKELGDFKDAKEVNEFVNQMNIL